MKKLTFESSMVLYRYCYTQVDVFFALFLLLSQQKVELIGLRLMLFKLFPEAKLSGLNSLYLY
jgi:hypothetical protein